MQDLNIMIVGVGGQGTLLASRVIGGAALKAGYDVKISEVHGMSQRGGSVVTYVRFGQGIRSPLVDKGQADLLLCFEQLEALRFAQYLKKGGVLISNTQKIDPMPVVAGSESYPDGIPELLKGRTDLHAVFIDAAELAKQCGDIRAVNILLIGVMAGLHLGGISREIWEETLRSTVPAKALDVNIKAFGEGYKRGKE